VGLEFLRQLTTRLGCGEELVAGLAGEGLQHRLLCALHLVWIWDAPPAIQYV